MSEGILNVPQSPGKKGRWIENHYLPTSPVLVTPQEQAKFIEILHENRGFVTIAAKKYGVCQRSVTRKMVEFPDFAIAVQNVRVFFEAQVLDQLEEISENCALDKKNITERIFQMNALNPGKYRPRQTNIQATSIHVSYGFQSPVAIDRKPEKRVKGAEVKANFTVETPK